MRTTKVCVCAFVGFLAESLLCGAKRAFKELASTRIACVLLCVCVYVCFARGWQESVRRQYVVFLVSVCVCYWLTWNLFTFSVLRLRKAYVLQLEVTRVRVYCTARERDTQPEKEQRRRCDNLDKFDTHTIFMRTQLFLSWDDPARRRRLMRPTGRLSRRPTFARRTQHTCSKNTRTTQTHAQSDF